MEERGGHTSNVILAKPHKKQTNKSVSDELYYDVKCIVGKHYKYSRKRGLEYKVRWEGYSEQDDTWQPVSKLKKDGVKWAIDEYEAKQKAKKQKQATKKQKKNETTKRRGRPPKQKTKAQSSNDIQESNINRGKEQEDQCNFNDESTHKSFSSKNLKKLERDDRRTSSDNGQQLANSILPKTLTNKHMDLQPMMHPPPPPPPSPSSLTKVSMPQRQTAQIADEPYRTVKQKLFSPSSQPTSSSRELCVNITETGKDIAEMAGSSSSGNRTKRRIRFSDEHGKALTQTRYFEVVEGERVNVTKAHLSREEIKHSDSQQEKVMLQRHCSQTVGKISFTDTHLMPLDSRLKRMAQQQPQHPHQLWSETTMKGGTTTVGKIKANGQYGHQSTQIQLSTQTQDESENDKHRSKSPPVLIVDEIDIKRTREVRDMLTNEQTAQTIQRPVCAGPSIDYYMIPKVYQKMSNSLAPLPPPPPPSPSLTNQYEEGQCKNQEEERKQKFKQEREKQEKEEKAYQERVSSIKELTGLTDPRTTRKINLEKLLEVADQVNKQQESTSQEIATTSKANNMGKSSLQQLIMKTYMRKYWGKIDIKSGEWLNSNENGEGTSGSSNETSSK